MFKSFITAIFLFCISNGSFAKEFYTVPLLITDYDIPALRDAIRESYTPELCMTELPNTSVETCDCIRDALAKNLSVKNLKLCKKAGNDECVATEFSAAKTALTKEQIEHCKSLSPT